MSLLKNSLIALLCSGSLAGCAAEPVIETVASPEFTTNKPGASIDFVYQAPKDLLPVENGVVTLTFFEVYPNGTLRLEVQADEGLQLISEVRKKEFSMAGNDPHEWELDVMANQNGVYYLNVLATVDLPNGKETGRAFAARINVGDFTATNARSSLKRNGVLSSDGATVMMEADEVIK